MPHTDSLFHVPILLDLPGPLVAPVAAYLVRHIHGTQVYSIHICTPPNPPALFLLSTKETGPTPPPSFCRTYTFPTDFSPHLPAPHGADYFYCALSRLPPSRKQAIDCRYPDSENTHVRQRIYDIYMRSCGNPDSPSRLFTVSPLGLRLFFQARAIHLLSFPRRPRFRPRGFRQWCGDANSPSC